MKAAADVNDARVFTFRNSLIESNLDMAKRAAGWAKRRLPTCIEFEDLHQSARLGLVEAANLFEVERDTPFSAYARKRVYGSVIEPFRNRRYRDYKHTQLVGDVSMLGSPDAEQGLAVRDARELISRAIRDLPRREQKLICWRYWHGAAMQDIARAFHISTSRVYKLHDHSIEELRCALARRIHIAIRGLGKILELLLPDGGSAPLASSGRPGGTWNEPM